MLKFWKIFYCFYKFLGLFPMNLRISPEQYSLAFSPIGIIYNICFLLVFITCNIYYFFYHLPNVDNSSEGKAISVLPRFFLALNCVIISTIVLKITFSQKFGVDIGNELIRSYLFISSFGEHVQKLDINKSQILVVVSELLIWSTKYIYQYWISEPWNSALEMTALYFGGILIHAMFVQFVCAVILMRDIIKTINGNFELARKIVFDRNQESLLYDEKTVGNILSLRDAGLHFYGVTSKVSDYFSLMMLGCVLEFFSGIIIDLYYIFKRTAIGGWSIETIEPSTILWMASDTFVLIMITHYVTSLIIEVNMQFLLVFYSDNPVG